MTGLSFVRWLGLVGWLVAPPVTGAPRTVYETGFEPPEFLAGYALDGQGDWLIPWVAWPPSEIHTSWVAEEYFEGRGQQAVIGFYPPDGPVSSVSVYRPLFIDPAGTDRPLVIFTVTMAILDDNEPHPSAFRWVVYNREDPARRLFSLDFDAGTSEISYLLQDDPVAWPTGRSFWHGHLYDLAVFMNFASNVWSATLNGELVVNAQPMAQDQRRLDLGDIDAAWVRFDDQTPFGDSYMVFDDFKVSTDVGYPLPCRLDPVEVLADGSFLVRLLGEPGRAYAVDASSDLVEWTALSTNTPGATASVVLDPGATSAPNRFYRARAVWP
jgi:hypothetical protein